MAYAANGNLIADSIIKDRASWLLLHPVVYSTDIPGVDMEDDMLGNEIYVFNG